MNSGEIETCSIDLLYIYDLDTREIHHRVTESACSRVISDITRNMLSNLPACSAILVFGERSSLCE